MPIYEYQCLACGTRTEQLQKISDPPLAACPKCGGEVKKLVSSPAFQFKGSGWYVTDYAGKSSGKSESSSSSETKSEAKSDGAKSDGGSSDTKAEAKSEPKAEKKDAAAKAD